MQVNQIIATGLIITNIMLLFSSSAQAQNRKPSVECNAALQRAKNKFKTIERSKLFIQVNEVFLNLTKVILLIVHFPICLG